MFKGAVWSWGSNAHGAIGILDEDEASEVLAEQFETAKIPRYIRALSNMTIVQVACGNQYSAVLTANGEVWTWGNGQHGKLGHLDQINQPLPKKIESLDSTPITKIACGQEHMMCIAKEGGLYSWGCGFFGRLGHAGVKAEFEPKEVKYFEHTPITHIWCGATSFAKDCHGNLFAWGSGGYGQIGNGQRMNEVLFPVQVPLSGVSHIACSERHVVAISDKGLFTWGSNAEGQLGLGNFKDANKPTKVVFPIVPGVAEKDFEPIHVSCGRTYTAIVTVTGSVYTFGSGDEGELGTGNLSAKSATPVKVKLPAETRIVKVSCGDTFVAALTGKNVLYAWGSHKTGQLGMGELYAGERVETRTKEYIGAKKAEEHDDFETIMGFTPKKGKKTRNTSTPKKKAEIKQQAQQSQSRQATMETLANLHTGRPVQWLYGVLDVVCGLNHCIALLDRDNRVLQLARDGDVVSLQGMFTEDMDNTKSIAKKADTFASEFYNALHWASLRNHPKVVSYLLQNMGMNQLLNQVCDNYCTPLHLAAIHGHVDVIQLLMEAKADADMQDSAGNTALHHAATAKRLDICAALILAGANANIENRKSKKPLEFFSLQESFDLKKKIKSFDVAIYFTPSEYKFCKNLRKKIESFHIVCSLNEEKHDPKTFIKASQAMIFVLSNESAISPDSLVYLRLAKELKKHVYPIWRHKANMSAALESLIYRNQLVDFTDDSKFIDSAAQLVAGLRNIFEDKKDSEQDSTTDDSAEVDAAFSKMVIHPNMIIPPADLVKEKQKYLYLCHDQRDSHQAALLAASLCDHDFICCYYNDDTQIVSDLITNCWTFLLVLSSRSAGSSIIRDQIALAENRQKLILPVLVQKSSISLDPAMTYTLARTARFPFFVGDNDVNACVEKLVDAVRLAKKVSLKSERLKNLREEVVVTNDKLSKSNKYIADIKAKVTTKKTLDMEQPVNWR